MPLGVSIGQGMDYSVDIVMCIDSTGSMASIIGDVKQNALSFYQQFVEEMANVSKSVQQLRIKVIAFRDFGFPIEPLIESKFFILNEESEDFLKFVSNIKAKGGGGDGPESSLEALALAMKSDWIKTGAVRRHVIIMYTDNAALELGTHNESPLYPKNIPTTFSELQDYWEGQVMEKRAKRLLIFAPKTSPWTTMGTDWTNVFHTPSKAGAGCDDTDIKTCIHMLVNSI